MDRREKMFASILDPSHRMLHLHGDRGDGDVFRHDAVLAAKAPADVGFDVPRPTAPLRWGVLKVARKSGAFANSIAFAVSQGRGGPVSVVLAAAPTRPHLLLKVAEELGAKCGSDEALRAAIAEDIVSIVPQDDAYLVRLHTSTVLRAVQEMQSK
jgi:carbon-monoxide dehydrogenase medium subunit